MSENDQNSGWRPEVVAIVHDLRAPLGVISGYADMLVAGDIGGVSNSALDAIVAIAAKAAEMRILLEGMLDLERVEGDAEVQRRVQSLDLSAAALESVDRARPRARVGGDTLDLVAAPAVSVRANPRFLGRILDNLLNNALTHGRHPGHVTVTVARTGSAGEVRVHDDGDGIPPAIRERLFAKFTADPGTATEMGFGLGLYISKALAEKIGGTLRYEKPVDGGATFVLELPLAA